MEEGDIEFLMQLTKSLEDSEIKLERAYNTNDSVKFNEIKRFIFQIQKQISEILK